MTARALPLFPPLWPAWLSAAVSSGGGLIGKAARALKQATGAGASATVRPAPEPGPPRTQAEVDRFRRLLLPLQDDAYAFALHLCRDASTAEDLAQEAYLKAYRGFSGYRGGDAKAWLLAIVRSCFLDWARGRKAWAAMVEPDAGEAVEAAPAGDANAEDVMVREAGVKQLRQAIEALPEPFKETLVLRELQEMNYRQIAEITGAPIGTVMSRLARARGMLIAALRREGAAGMSAPCPDKEPMLHALLDGELDAANASALEAHLKTCPGCAQRLAALQALHERLAELPPATAPAALKRRIETMIEREARRSARPARPGLTAGWIAAGAMTLVAASLVITPLAAGPSLPQQLAEAHVRSLLAAHLVDIPTSDKHVVRPWFDGKIGYAPPAAPDLKDQGFPLVGGRLDYAEGRPIAAIVYRRRQHVINLFVLPTPKGIALPRLPWLGGGPAPGGYAMLHWSDRGLDYWAVSDVEPDELKGFREAFERAAG